MDESSRREHANLVVVLNEHRHRDYSASADRHHMEEELVRQGLLERITLPNGRPAYKVVTRHHPPVHA